jgi:hypothetical protein
MNRNTLSALRSPVSLQGLALSLARGGGGGAASQPEPPGLSRRNSACLRTFVAAALFLTGTLGSSWFAVLEMLQNADYVLTTRGTALSGPAHLGIGAVAGTPSKRGGTQIEGQVKQQQQQQRHQAAALHFLRTSIPRACTLPYSGHLTRVPCKRIPRSSILLARYASRAWRWSACRVALISMPVLVLGCLGCGRGYYSKCEHECYELVTPRTERISRRGVSGNHTPWTLVRYVPLPLSTPIEKMVRTAVRRLWDCPPGRVSLRSIFNVSRIGHLISHGRDHLTPPLRSPSPRNAASHPRRRPFT